MRYDLHCHTKYSSCSLNSPQVILKVAAKRGLNGITITDHNEIKGALAVKRLNKNRDFEVVIGEEVMTDKCELLCYYLNNRLNPGDTESVIDQVRQQGALCSIAHPFTFGIYRKSFHLGNSAVLKKVDAIEAFNARTDSSANAKAKSLAHKFSLAMTAGSDAHMPWEIGKACVVFEGDLRTAILRKQILIEGSNSFCQVNRCFTLPIKILHNFL